MKRYTMTPISRKIQKLPNSTVKVNPRHSIQIDSHTKRDIKMVRDIGYKKQCTDNIYNFLTENSFEGGLSQKILQNPSNKDFQNMFRFIMSYIDDYEYTSRFDEDVINILKILKYPYSSEITKSQLSAITPHIWPILLSMLSWTVDLLLTIENATENNKQNVDIIFYDFVSSGYMKYLQGNDDKALEDEFEIKIQESYADMFSDIDENKTKLELLENEIQELQSGFTETDMLEQKKVSILEDLNGLIASQKQLESKRSKYTNSIKKITEEIANIEESVEELKCIHEDLQDKIKKQKLNPADVKVMNKEKVELYRELEKITPEKEQFMIKNKKLEKKMTEMQEEIDKLLFDFSTVRQDLCFKLEKDNNLNFYFTRSIDDIKTTLENEYNKNLQHMEELRINKDMANRNKEDKEMVLREIENKIENNQNKLLGIGELYLEKKASSEEDQKKNKNQMDKLERDLLQLNLDSNSSLIHSEQSLHTARINLDVITNKCKQEREMIKNLIYNFYNNMENYKNGLRRMNSKMQSLYNSKDM